MKTARRVFITGSQRNRVNASCPCGKSNRDGKFATEKGFEGKPVGHCHSCGKDFWGDSGTIVKDYVYEPPVYCTPDMKDVIEHFDTELRSEFAQFLVKTLGEEKAVEIVKMYYLGVLDSVHGTDLNSDVIFWQMDTVPKLRTGKVMRYNDKGKRQNYINWWNRIKGGNCELRQYFFGGHLIEDYEKPIAIVESEKTACLMSIFNPTFIWIACGSATNLQDVKCRSISDYEVVLFPDHKQYDRWKEKANQFDFEISKDCEIWFDQGIISKGDDIADYYLNLTERVNLEVVKIDPEWNQEEYDSIFKNPKKSLRR